MSDCRFREIFGANASSTKHSPPVAILTITQYKTYSSETATRFIHQMILGLYKPPWDILLPTNEILEPLMCETQVDSFGTELSFFQSL